VKGSIRHPKAEVLTVVASGSAPDSSVAAGPVAAAIGAAALDL
jgi:hypothetical protein